MSSITDVYSPRTTFRCTRLRGAKVGGSVCQFCAVGCSQLGFFKDGKLIDVEGDPRSSVNEGRLCPKGSSTYALNENPYRKVKPMYRAQVRITGKKYPWTGCSIPLRNVFGKLETKVL